MEYWRGEQKYFYNDNIRYLPILRRKINEQQTSRSYYLLLLLLFLKLR